MRELRFRVWDIVKKNWTREDINLYTSENGLLVGGIADGGLVFQEFTGLEDKNKKEIFEGDIITFEIGNHSYVGEIKFEGGAFIVGCNELDDSYRSLIEFDIEEDTMWQVRVLGNIYENPDLLKDLNQDKCEHGRK